MGCLYFAALCSLGACREPSTDGPPEDGTSGEDIASPMRMPTPIAGVYIAITAEPTLPFAFEVLDGDGTRVLVAERPAIALLETPAVPFEFSVRPLGDDDPDHRLNAILQSTGCRSLFFTASSTGNAADPPVDAPFAPSIGPGVDEARWVFNLGASPLLLRSELAPLVEVPPGGGSQIEDATQTAIDVLSLQHQWLGTVPLDHPHTMLLPSGTESLRYVAIDAGPHCVVRSGGTVSSER